MKTSLYVIGCSFLFLLMVSSAYAETRYISDQLIVTVRSGKGNQYKILETLPTSTPVEVLEEDKTYVKVVTQKGVLAAHIIFIMSINNASAYFGNCCLISSSTCSATDSGCSSGNI